MTGPVSPTGPPTTAGHSVLVVPIPALETLVVARHAHYDRDYVSADPTFAHAHVTILGPWLTQADLADPVRANAALTAVRDIASATRGFDIDFAHVDTFPNGIIHLVPEPAEPFAALTAAVYREFPAYPPYAGQFGVVQPHLTLDAVGAGVTEAWFNTFFLGYAARVSGDLAVGLVPIALLLVTIYVAVYGLSLIWCFAYY